MKSLRDEFIVDCCFGMPGVSMDRERLVTDPATGLFLDRRNERAFQIWLRGRTHHSVEVRDYFLRSHPELTEVLNEMRDAGLAARNPGGS